MSQAAEATSCWITAVSCGDDECGGTRKRAMLLQRNFCFAGLYGAQDGDDKAPSHFCSGGPFCYQSVFQLVANRL